MSLGKFEQTNSVKYNQLWANSWGNTNLAAHLSDFFVLSAVFNSSDSSLSLNGNNVANLNPSPMWTSSLKDGIRIVQDQNTSDFLNREVSLMAPIRSNS